MESDQDKEEQKKKIYKIAVVGGRDYNDYAHLTESLNPIILNLKDKYELFIVSGGCKGADSLASQYAKENLIRLIEFLPEWNTKGLAAGPIRNKQIVQNANEVIAFWDGKSKGTKSTIELTRFYKKPLKIVFY